MKLKILCGILSLAALTLPLQAMAVPVTVDIAAKLFYGLGKCSGTTIGADIVSAPPTGKGACDGNPAPDTTSQHDLSFAFGGGWDASDTAQHEFDMVYMHAFHFAGDTSSSPVAVTFDADSAAGSTGGLSAGPCAPGTPLPGGDTDCSASPGLVHDLFFKRTVTVNGIDFVVTQSGTLLVTWGNIPPGNSDFLTLAPTSLTVLLAGGTLTINFDGTTAPVIITADPEIILGGSILFTPAAAPVPSTLALLGLGLAGRGVRRRRTD